MFCYTSQLKKKQKTKNKNKNKNKTAKNRLLDAEWHTDLPDHVRVESSSCCFPWELVSFVRPRKLVSFDQGQVTRSPPIEQRISVGRYNKCAFSMVNFYYNCCRLGRSILMYNWQS